MKLTAQPQSLLEYIGKLSTLAPVPLMDTHIAFVVSRTIIEAVDLGIFETLAERPKSIMEVAEDCRLSSYALRSFLGTLTSSGYLKYKNEKFSLTKLSSKWMLKKNKQSLTNQILFLKILWGWMDDMNNFVKTGKSEQYHDHFTDGQADLYQKGMRSVARVSAGEVGKRTPVPKGATEMLDIGGAHGIFSVAICKNHPGLKSTILDLPLAIQKAAPLLAQEKMGEVVIHKAGNALTEDLGKEKYDLIFIANLMHHFTAEENLRLVERVAIALKPGGILAVQEFIRPDKPKASDQVGAALDLFFALSSTSGTWSIKEISQWQKNAGLKIKKPVKFLTLPGAAQVVAEKIVRTVD
ncbi:MAG TPA: methyltransferase [Cytophagaceae bacterium]|nr:methyltransferase [Cytophagaceae bacterium]